MFEKVSIFSLVICKPRQPLPRFHVFRSFVRFKGFLEQRAYSAYIQGRVLP